MYAIRNEFELYSGMNVKKLLAKYRRKICCLIDCNFTRIHNHLVRKQTLNYFEKLTK